jgi:cellulose synthase/poly-beta-1,6-N-acetylglucosamine synthase-like glycosyltransferase
VDADSVLQRDSLQRVVYPFLEDPTTLATGGTIRIANGCKIKDGFLIEPGLPDNLLAQFQVVEYLRAFLFGRMGWSPLNALMIISGAFGLFHKNTVIAIGGYRKDSIGEDMELVVRIHHEMRLWGKPYRITFVPDPICWTEAPENLSTLRKQRIRWQRGLAESLFQHIDLLFHRDGGTVGWLAFPFFLLFECLGPLLEVVGYLLMIVLFFFGLIPNYAMLAFLVVSIGLGILLSVCALFLEEMSFHLYPRMSHMFTLFLAAVAENLGYRQLNSLWRLEGILSWLFGRKKSWGDMKRKKITHS